MKHTGLCSSVLAIVMMSVPVGLAAAAGLPTLYGADDEPLPFATLDEVESFLATAEVVSSTDISSGITAPKKLLLEQGGVRAHALFKSVDKVSRGKTDLDGYILIDLKDNHLFDCAAYRLDRLLGLGRVPPSVARRIDGRSGTVTLWIEHAITESGRRERGVEPPDPVRFEQQRQMMRIFDDLLGNVDSNLGNVLIDRSWRFWFIDHTRCFVTNRSLPQPEAVTSCERGFFHALEGLDEAEVTNALAPYLDKREIRALLARREAILDRLHSQIARRGEQAVLFDIAPPGPQRGDW